MERRNVYVEQPRIIWSDKDIIIAIKPAGVLSEDHPGGMPELLRQALGDPKADIRSVHRLDRAVSGLMVYARNAQAASVLIRDIAERKFEKQYLAVTEGVPKEAEGRMEDLLYHSARENKTYVVGRKRKGVREAALEYRMLQEKDGKALVQVRLLTGRTHQIRVQFASRRLPLVGDYRYGATREQAGDQRCATTKENQAEDQRCATTKENQAGDQRCVTTKENQAGDHRCVTTKENQAEDHRCDTTHENLSAGNSGRRASQSGTDPGIALWSYSLKFRHPKTREELSFQEQPPQAEPWCFFDTSGIL